MVFYHYSGCDISTGYCKRSLTDQTSKASAGQRHQGQGIASSLAFGGKGLFASTSGIRPGLDSSRSRDPWRFLYGSHRGDNLQPSSMDDREGEEEYREDDEYEDEDGADESRAEDYYDGEDDDEESKDYQTGDDSDESIDRDDDSEDQEEDGKEINADSALMMLIMDDDNEEIEQIVAAAEDDGDEALDEDAQEYRSIVDSTESSWDEEATRQEEAFVDIWNESASESLSEEDFLELEEDYVVPFRDRPLESRPQQLEQSTAGISLRSRLDPSTKYMIYLPSGGLTFQFYGMLRAVMVAKSLGRTLIVPPITASRLDDSRKSQPWSDYFDLDTFMQLTGAKVIELQDLRELSSIRRESSETLRCHVTCDIGSVHPLDDTAKEFLREWRFDLSLDSTWTEGASSTGFNSLVQSLRVQEENEPSLVCITNAFKVDVPAREDWDLFGRYLYFKPQVQKFFVELVQALNSGYNGIPSSSSSSAAEVRSWQEQMQAQRKYVNEQAGGDREDSMDHSRAKIYPHNEHADHQDMAVTIDRAKLVNAGANRNDDSNNNRNDPFNEHTYNNNHRYNSYYTGHHINSDHNTVPTPLGPYIAIHVVRGPEFSNYCQLHFPHQRRLFQQHQISSSLSSCLPSAQELALKLHTTEVHNPELRGLPVYVIVSSSSSASSATSSLFSSNRLSSSEEGLFGRTTLFEDEDSDMNSVQRLQKDAHTIGREEQQRELDEFRAMGWHVLDHQAMGSQRVLGSFGALMIEQLFMARAQAMIGVRISSAAKIGAYRQEDWYGRRAIFM